MRVGNFYKRQCAGGAEFEVVLHHGEDRAACIQELRARHIEVRDDASIGDFTIHIDDPLDWAQVGAVIAGEIFGETDRPTAHAGSAASGHFS